MSPSPRPTPQVQLQAGLDVEAHQFPAARLENPEPASFTHYILHHGVLLTPDAESDPQNTLSTLSTKCAEH